MPVDVDKRPLKQEKRKKRPQNRKGTAPQDRKPSDNYSAPDTYHKKKKKKKKTTVASLPTLPAKFEWGV